MNPTDWIVLLGTMLGIAAYGTWRTRHTNHLNTYLKGSRTAGWGTIGLSIMATQASTITYLSLPGQAYESGMAFIQNYFGLPLALIIICAFFLPIYRRLNVYTAYEYLGKRFDSKTRLLGACLFLLQRGVQSGVTVYAPAIILSTVLGWRVDLTIIFTGLVVIVYTVTGGSNAVSLTQKWQMAVIFGGMLTAFGMLLAKLPSGSLSVAGALGKLQAVDFSVDPNKRYTFWSGLFGGLFLSLSYFGTDQSQVQRYLGGASSREGRLGLMFNATVKIPMQFFIVVVGALLFAYFQLQPDTPVFFNRVEWQHHRQGPSATAFRAIEEKYASLHSVERERIANWLALRKTRDPAALSEAKAGMVEGQAAVDDVRKEAKQLLLSANPRANVKDSDYIFITFILSQLPHGAIGLLLAVMFASTLCSKAAELNALGTASTIDLWRHFRPLAAHDEARNVRAARWFTAFWGLFAIGFALFAGFAENLIQALNIIASIFYGVVLGIFLVAFFLRRVTGTAVFFSAIAAQGLVILMYFTLSIGYLWYNLIGCVACIGLSLLLQTAFRFAPSAEEGASR
jgi:Na+/proline symporter